MSTKLLTQNKRNKVTLNLVYKNTTIKLNIIQTEFCPIDCNNEAKKVQDAITSSL